MKEKTEKHDENYTLKKNKHLRDKENTLNHSNMSSIASFSSLLKSSTKSLGNCSTESSHESISSNENCVSLTTTIAVAYPKIFEEQKVFEEISKKNKKTVETAKAHHYLHCDYVIVPDKEATLTDVVMYAVAAKIFVDEESRIVKVWEDGGKFWVAWIHNHQIVINLDNIMELHNHTVDVTFWEAKDKMSHKARVDRPKVIKLPSTTEVDISLEIVGDVVERLSSLWMSMQPKDSVTDEQDDGHSKVERDTRPTR